MTVHVEPTLADMAAVYTHSREGGPRSARFRAYLAALGPTGRASLGAYNPMAGERATQTVAALLAMDAESVMADAGREVLAALEVRSEVTLALVVMSPGMWTDRIATEVTTRTTAAHSVTQGLVVMWAGEPATVEAVRAQARRECARIAWSIAHGAADTLERALEREGLAEAVAEGTQENDLGDIKAAIDMFRHSTEPGEIATVMLGDEVARVLGWQELGIEGNAGLRWAAERVRRSIEVRGLPATLRTTGLLQ